jgi:hypothetical protein
MLRVVVLVAVVAGWLAGAATRAEADTVALLPLDGEKRLELYGQPVASEIGRALQAGGVDVVVVGAKMAVPDRAQLIVDGTIKADKKNAITLSIRIRDPHSGTVLETIPASATNLTTIDKAAAELSTRLVPVVKSHLKAIAAATAVERPHDPPITDGPAAEPVPVPARPTFPAVVVAVSAPASPMPALALLVTGVADEVPRWAALHKRDARKVDAAQLGRATGIRTVQDAGADIGVAVEVLAFTVEPGEVPLARARARIRIVHKGTIVFERVVRTDSIVGDKRITEQEMSARTGREILAIANAQLRRLVAGWR